MALMIAGVVACAMALIPGMPIVPFLLVGVALIVISRRLSRGDQRRRQEAADNLASEEAAPPADSPAELMGQMRVHALEVQRAADLADLVSGVSDDLLTRVKALRRRITMELGVVVPPVRTRDSVDLPPSTDDLRGGGL